LEYKLSTLNPGESGTVVHVEGSGQIRKRILDMGIVPGVRIEIIRAAPMGDPIELKLRGYLLTLRKNEAESILVSKEVSQ
jgi:Fe2+ transport system protein FeoA